MRINCLRAGSAQLAALLLCACGGGGSDSTPSPTASPPTPPTMSKAEAYRFLNQATFGATEAAAQQLQTQTFEQWIDAQLARTPTLQLPSIQTAYAALPQPVTNIGQLHTNRINMWLTNSIRGSDQLRQRVAFALSEIMVVSQGSLNGYPFAVGDYYDMLARNAFGDYRTLIEQVTLHPAMGVYLSMLGNQKPNAARNIRPDENYARELMQLFAIGLVELNLDGTVKLDGQAQPIPTYDQATIEGFAHVFTGWTWSGGSSFSAARATIPNTTMPMQAYAEQHDTGAKRVLSYSGAALTNIPAGQTPAKDLADALDNIAGHPNVAPFISKQLIQRLVTSNPSPQYVERIARVFQNDSAGRRGNLGAVVRAILLDDEARTSVNGGKVKEPLLRLTQLWRAYNANSASGALTAPNLTGIFGQGPLQASSVFNFFSPSYAPPGEIANASLVAPELQIATEYLNTQITNYFNTTAYCYVPAPVSPPCPALGSQTVYLDTAAEMAVAADAGALVDRVAERLFAGQISDTLRMEARAQVERVPSTLPAVRVAEAIYLMISSPDYAWQQ